MLKKYWAVFGHGRFPTIGETSIKNAHPFEHRHITLMHNGTIKNHEKLNEKYKKDFAVDSELICWMVSEIGIKETIKEIDGAYALIYFDSKEDAVNIVRNYERPLWIGKNSFNDRAVFGSEKHYLKWADEKGPMINEIKEVPTNTLLTIRKVGGKLDIQQSECYKHTNSSGWKGGYGVIMMKSILLLMFLSMFLLLLLTERPLNISRHIQHLNLPSTKLLYVKMRS